MRYWEKILAIVAGTSLIVMTLLALSTPYPEEYFIPFWSAFPSTLWISFGVVIVSSLSLILSAIFTRTRSWRYGAIFLGCGYLVYFALPRLLGLRFWAPPRTDMYAHIGNARYILETGEISSQNGYPTLHVFLAEVSTITGIELEPLMLFTWLHTILFISGIALFAKELFESRRAGLCALVAAFPLVYGSRHYEWMPWFVSFTLIPMTLFLFERYRHVRTRKQFLVTVPVLLAFSFFHPMTSAVLFGILLTFVVVERLYRLFPTTKQVQKPLYSPILALIVFIPYVTWTINNTGVEDHIVRIVVGILSSGDNQGVASESGRAAESGYTVAQLFFEFIVGQWGHFLVYLALGGLISVYIFYSVVAGKYGMAPALLLGLFASGIALAIAGLLFDLVASEPIRINQVSVLAAILLLCFTLLRIQSIHKERRLRAVHVFVLGAVLLTILFASLAGPLQFYNEDRHVVESEYSGTEHALEHQIFSTPTIASDLPNRHTVYQLGVEEASTIPWYNWPFQGRSNNPPAHLGYDRNENISETFRSSVYLHTQDRDTEWWKLEPENRYQYIRYYTQRDVDSLQNDSAAHNVYSNGNYRIWLINSAD